MRSEKIAIGLTQCMRPTFYLLLFTFYFVTRCLSPIAMHRAVVEYDRTTSQVEAELLLLNIARARHYRPVHFTAVSSVAATFDFRAEAGIAGGFGRATDASERPLNLSYSTSVAENPTVTIVPISTRPARGYRCSRALSGWR